VTSDSHSQVLSGHNIKWTTSVCQIIHASLF